MSRDPSRIPEVISALGELWLMNPDLRLGQVMGNASITFYTEDDNALLGLRQWTEYYKERHAGMGE